MLKKKKTHHRKGADKNFVLWELFFERIVQNIDSFVFVTDSSGEVVFINSRFRDFFGYEKITIKGKNWSGIVPAKYRGIILKVFSNIKKEKNVSQFDSPVKKKDGSVDHFIWLSIPLRNKRRMYYFFAGTKDDRGNVDGIKVHKLTSKRLNEIYKGFVDSIFAASMVSDDQTASHAARVMQLAVKLGKKMKLGRGQLENLKAAALLHDIGKLAVRDEILLKKGRLSENEFREIKKHPFWGAEVIKMVYFLYDVVPIISSHHEHYNGKGYPLAIDGKKIPVESRILSVADVYEALIADRSYRKGYSRREAVGIMKKEQGKKLDPHITDIFIEMIEKGEIKI